MTDLPNGYIPRKGDTVLVRAVVKYNGDAEELVHVHRVDNKYSTLTVGREDIVALSIRAWDERDKVITPTGLLGEILATDGAEAWVKLGPSSTGVFFAKDLREAHEEIKAAPIIPILEPGDGSETEGIKS